MKKSLINKELIKFVTTDEMASTFIRPVVVDNFSKLAEELKLINIKPQEAYDLIHKSKFQLNSRYYWTLTRITIYLANRWNELRQIAEENGIKLRKEKYNLNSIGRFVYDIFKSEEIMKLAKDKKIFSKKIDSCRKAVNGISYRKKFKLYYPNGKFDARKEVQNLQKLISEKKHRSKFIKKKWKIDLKSFAMGKGKYDVTSIKVIILMFTQSQIDFLR